MAGGMFDSSRTRVAPVFEQLARLSRSDWPASLLRLASRHGAGAKFAQLNLTFKAGYWGAAEKGLNPPVSFLSWLIRNLRPPVGPTTIGEERKHLMTGDPATIEAALVLLRSNPEPGRAWYIFEGKTFPDAFIITPDALIVVEGKRTEPGPTTSTTWMEGRHQIWRHIDAAWEIRGRRAVFGLFIVEGTGSRGVVPNRWQTAVEEAISESALALSFPHRGTAERRALADCLLGVTTWQTVCREFGVDYAALPDRISSSGHTDLAGPAESPP